PDTHPQDWVHRWRGAAVYFFALEVISFLSQYFVHLLNLLSFLTVGPLLLLLAVVSYPFQPQRLWLLCAAVVIFAVVLAALKIFVQLERDELVSRVAGTTPNRLNFHWSFLGNIVTYTGPMLGILAAASTDLSEMIRVWLEPIFRVIR